MSLITYNFISEYLQGNTEVSIILPDRPFSTTPQDFYRRENRYPVLWLLHGTFGDYSHWVRLTNVELYAEERDIIVVMPSALNSNYSNWNESMLGYRMYDYLTEELMPLIYGWFPASDRREDNFIAGLSMGGRGTIKYAANHPDKFAAAAVFSAVPMNFSQFAPGNPCPFLNTEDTRTKLSIENAGGLDAYVNSEENVWAVLEAQAGKGTLPRLMFTCGQDDQMLAEKYLEFQAFCKEKGIEAEWFFPEGYRHEWRFWDLSLQKALDFFGLPKLHD